MKPQFKIEVYRDGEWILQDTTNDVMEAYQLASSLCHQTQEETIRVVYPPGFVDEVRQLDFDDFEEDQGSPGYRLAAIIVNFVVAILFFWWLYSRGL